MGYLKKNSIDEIKSTKLKYTSYKLFKNIKYDSILAMSSDELHITRHADAPLMTECNNNDDKKENGM